MGLNRVIDRKARKGHSCEQCGVVIPKGAKYKYHYGVHDGSFFVNKMHTECEAEMIILNSDSHDDEWFSLSDLHGEGSHPFNFNEHKRKMGEKYEQHRAKATN